MAQPAALRLTPFELQEAYKAGDPAVAALYAAGPWQWPAEALQRPNPITPAALAEWRVFLTPYVTDATHLAPLDRLADPRALVVVTGQQAGAGLGPMMALWKALAARHWARQVEAETGRPCVPVFWIASDDHDLAEIAPVQWLGADGQRRAASVAPDAIGNTRAVWRVPVDIPRAEQFIDLLSTTTAETEFRPALLDDLSAALLSPGATFESQFLSLFCRWLLPLGIVPLAPRLGFVRQGATAIMRAEIETAPATNDHIARASDRLAALGVEPPVHRAGNEANFFIEVGDIRGKATVEGDSIAIETPGTREQLAVYTRAELLAILSAEPHRFSPNALLRPLVQDAVLPTIAYIPGPTEFAYHAQIADLYAVFGVPRPALAPRPSVALVEPAVRRAASRLGLDHGQLGASTYAALVAAFDALPAGEVGESLEREFARFAQAIDHIESRIAAVTRDTGTTKAMDKLKEGAEGNLARLRERARAWLGTLDTDKARAREKITHALFPDGLAQERSIGLLAPLMIQHGVAAIADIAGRIDYRASGFQAVDAAPPPTE